MNTRYFYAILPEPGARDLTCASAALMKASLQLRGRPISARRLHLTCHFIGRHAGRSADLESRAIAAGDRLDAAAFRIVFDHARSLERDGVAPCVFAASTVPPALTALHRRLRAADDDPTPFAREASPRFVPHVTWLYSEDRIHGAMPITPIAWEARRVVLASHADGDRQYRLLRAWDLR